MALAETTTIQPVARATASGDRRSLADVRRAGIRAVAMLAEAEQLRARAIADLVEFDGVDAHVTLGYATPQRHLAHGAGVSNSEAHRLHQLIRFCACHPSVARALADDRLTLDHARLLASTAKSVGHDAFADAVDDLIAAADDVDIDVFTTRLDTWRWRRRPDATAEGVEERFAQRELVVQPDVFGGSRGRFVLDPAATALLTAALHTRPDPAHSICGPRTLRQRQADQLAEIADHYLATCGRRGGDVEEGPLDDEVAGAPAPAGERRGGTHTVDVVIDLNTLFDRAFDLDDHRDPSGAVDWESIRAEFANSGTTPRPVLEQFICDASWRNLITAGPRVVLDYNAATPEIPRALRRAVQRRDHRCQFDGCDRGWQWCDVHHLRPRHQGGHTDLANLALVCRFHHTLVHQGGWQLTRDGAGRLLTTSP